MPWIQNVSLACVKKGHHIDCGDNSMLIQIVDPDMEFPTPFYNFKEVRQFKFLDVEQPEWEHAIKDQDSQGLVDALNYALNNRMNVVVHCVAGLCRSGAVCEVGVMMGFDDAQSVRHPNILVKTKMMKVLGWTYE